LSITKTFNRFGKVTCGLLLVCLLLLTSCSNQPPSRFEQAQQESTQAGKRNIAVEKQALEGAKFNQFFPSSSDGYERVFIQEKSGFVQAKLKRNGQELALMSIFDTISNKTAADEFSQSTEQIKDYPSLEKGSNTTAVLVNNRFQVKITSTDSSFTKNERVLWLEKFNLDGLAKLK
jgi:hypothetical protein